ncbi:hypothetical protein AZI86_10725 [Bdellovibrio bacteriovorus]|uniref:MotA/TolQ/ExbB proton channel domain-containing protein n=1 Tax=Bdellovibrio bacteriovorus TaxID=959 RepID=A0A150WLK9_BDEBC|nr:MotA/TolQ/ExbB proton channel family protein [Bdellovibrio bacteriovorus]KYG64677.1 hypothetical protein AZI86_10725 [Bdellovibrio bacteriovorus]
MNFSTIFGFIVAVIVFLTALFTATTAREIFLDPHGILIVFGGTAAAAMLCFPLATIFTSFKVIVSKFFGKFDHRREKVINEIVELAKIQDENPAQLRDRVNSVQNEFLKEGMLLMLDGALSGEQLESVLQKRALVTFKRHTKEASTFKVLAKFPPAFGLMGTTIGMIALLQSLGSADAYKKLGPAMAIGLVATLYGIALANFVFIPVGENLSKLNEDDHQMREIVIDGIALLREKQHALLVEEYLKSYLSPAERSAVKRAA